jgi:hypothetical protein
VDQNQRAHGSNTRMDSANTAINTLESINSGSPVQEGTNYFVFGRKFRITVEDEDMAFEFKRQALLKVNGFGITIMSKKQLAVQLRKHYNASTDDCQIQYCLP